MEKQKAMTDETEILEESALDANESENGKEKVRERQSCAFFQTSLATRQSSSCPLTNPGHARNEEISPLTKNPVSLTIPIPSAKFPSKRSPRKEPYKPHPPTHPISSHQSTPPGTVFPPAPTALPPPMPAASKPPPPPPPAAPLHPSCGLACRLSMNMGFLPSLSSCLKRSKGFSFKPRQRSWSPCTMYRAYWRQSSWML